MNPTLWDSSVIVGCPQCQIETRVDAAVHAQAVAGRAIQCWHCGWRYESNPPVLKRMMPDQVIAFDGRATIRVGDLVVVRRVDSSHHVKRVLAIGGQTVSADRFGQLLVDEEPPIIPSWILVHDSTRGVAAQRNLARWQSTDDGWMVYSHRSVYRGNHPSPIYDDYPGNWTVDRKLNPVNHLAIELDLPLLPTPCSIEQQWWTNEGVRRASTSLMSSDPTPQRVTSMDAELTDPTNPIHRDTQRANIVNANQPVAIRITTSGGEVSKPVPPTGIRLQRPLVYRVDHHRNRFEPITLADDQLFVVGDNVPVSIDSRHWGPILLSDIIGIVR